MRPLPIAAATLAALTILPAAASAAWKPPRVTNVNYDVQISGVHTIKWHDQTEGYPDPGRSWDMGEGTQTMRFSTPEPISYGGVSTVGTTPDGKRLAPLTIFALLPRNPEVRATLHRSGDWKVNSICDSEGGCAGSVEVNDLEPPRDCSDRTARLPAGLDVEPLPGRDDSPVRRAVVEFGTVDLAHLWDRCPPDVWGAKGSLQLTQPPLKSPFGGAVRKLQRLRRGATTTFKTRVRTGYTVMDGATPGRCPKLSGVGHTECATTTITVKAKRTR